MKFCAQMFEYIIASISEPSEMTLCTTEELLLMRREYPAVPEIYFEYMQVVGWGDIGGMMIYSGLIEANDMLNARGISVTNIVLFGDNWQGSCYGFDLGQHGQLVEVTPEGEIESVDHDFIELVSMYAN